MMRFATNLKRLSWAAVAVVAAWLGFVLLRARPEDLPWTRLDLARPVGAFTGRRLAALGDDPAACRAALARAGVADRPAPPVAGPGTCGYRDGVRIATGGARAIAYRPAGPVARCGVAAALAVWEWEVVQPAAVARFGVPVAAIDHYGTFSCRRIAGSAARAWSEHATADAIDIAGFRLADGHRVAVARDWAGPGADAAFLRDVRDGACRLFAIVLSPDYNAAHRDHLHLDQAARGALGWRACR